MRLDLLSPSPGAYRVTADSKIAEVPGAGALTAMDAPDWLHKREVAYSS